MTEENTENQNIETPNPEIERYKAKAAAAEKEAIELRKKYGDPFKKAGYDPSQVLTEYQQLKAAAEEREAEIAKKSGDFEKLLAQKEKHWQTEAEKLKAELDTVRRSEHQAVVKSGLQSALAEAGATTEGLELLPDLLHNRVKIETVDGKRVVKVYEADGETPLLNKQGEPANLGDLSASLTAKYPSLFKAANKSGSGTQPNTGGGAAIKTISRDAFNALSQSARAAHIRDGGKVTD